MRKAFVNVFGGGSGSSTGGVERLGDLLDVSDSVDNPLTLQDGQALLYNGFTNQWENKAIDYTKLQNLPVIPTNSSFSFVGLSDTAEPSLPDGYVKWNSTGTQLVYSTTIPADSITGLAPVAKTGDYNDLLNTPTLAPVAFSGNYYDLLNIPATTEITLTGDVTGFGNPTIPTSLATVNPNVGTFGGATQVPQLTVDGKGRITGVVNVPIVLTSGTVTSVAASGLRGVIASVLHPTTTPAITITLGDIQPVSVATGAITASSVVATGTVTGSNISGINTGDQTIVLSGDVSGTGTGAITATLSTVNAAPGVYGDSHLVPTITVNEKGLVTSVTTQHVDTTARDLVPTDDVFVVEARHQYIVTSVFEVEGYIVNNGVIAIL
jgi:hypothetical protein